MVVREIKSEAEFEQALIEAKNALVVVDFSATWCGPCKMMAGPFEQLSSEHPGAFFLSVDVDRNAGIAQQFGISAMPTFVLLRNRVRLDVLKGANAAALKTLVAKHAASVDGSGGAGGRGVVEGVGAYVSLNSLVNVAQLECLNRRNNQRPLDALFANNNDNDTNDAFLESDVDEQLILNVSFNQQVKVPAIPKLNHNLCRFTPSNFAPKTIKLYPNRLHMDFDEADDIEPAQTLSLTPADFDPKQATQLRFVKFQNIFVVDNQKESETTRIKNITFFGTPVEQTRNLSELAKNEH